MRIWGSCFSFLQEQNPRKGLVYLEIDPRRQDWEKRENERGKEEKPRKVQDWTESCSGERNVQYPIQIPFERPEMAHLFIGPVFCWMRVTSRDVNSLEFLALYKGWASFFDFSKSVKAESGERLVGGGSVQ